MLPSSCLDGSVTPVGPGLNPQYTSAPKAGGGCGLLTRTQNEPTNTTVWVRIILKLFFTFDPFKVTQEEIRSTLRLQDHVVLLDDLAEYIYHVGSSTTLHSVTRSGLIAGGSDAKEREANSVLHSRESHRYSRTLADGVRLDEAIKTLYTGSI